MLSLPAYLFYIFLSCMSFVHHSHPDLRVHPEHASLFPPPLHLRAFERRGERSNFLFDLQHAFCSLLSSRTSHCLFHPVQLSISCFVVRYGHIEEACSVYSATAEARV